MTIEPRALAAHPELQVWWEKIEAAHRATISEYARAVDVGGDMGLVIYFNATTRFWLALADANERIGAPFNRETVRSVVLDNWPRWEISAVEERVRNVASAYELRLRLPYAGEKDSRMTAAMDVVAALENVACEEPSEAVRKSIQQFRKKVRGSNLFLLNRDTLEVEIIDAESRLLRGLPGKAGRPT